MILPHQGLPIALSELLAACSPSSPGRTAVVPAKFVVSVFHVTKPCRTAGAQWLTLWMRSGWPSDGCGPGRKAVVPAKFVIFVFHVTRPCRMAGAQWLAL